MRALPLLALLASTAGCTGLATGVIADALAEGGGGVYATDDDPELVRAAVPSGLKIMESVLASEPDHTGLLLALCKGYGQYAYAFAEDDLEVAAEDDPGKAAPLRDRARRLWMRAHGYCRRGLAATHEGWNPDADGLAKLEEDDVGLAYWAAATWAGAIAVSKDPSLLADLDKAMALAERAAQLDGEYSDGAPHGLVGTLLAAIPGGDMKRAREELEKAAELAGPGKMLPVLSLARLGVKIKDRALVEKSMKRVLEFDIDSAPESRLENVLAQKRARRLQAEVADLFMDDPPAEGGQG